MFESVLPRSLPGKTRRISWSGPHADESCDSPVRKWDAMFFASLHSSGGAFPHTSLEIDLAPAHPQYFVEACGC